MIGDRDGTFSGAAPHRAVVDIGSNTVRLVIYGGARRAPTVLLNEKVAARLGAELALTGRLPDEAMACALGALRRYRRILSDLEVTEVDVIATAATRIASNGPQFIEQVRACGFDPVLLSGEEEARTSAMGVIGALPGARGVVLDLGGASLELVSIADGKATDGVSLPMGTLILPDLRSGGGMQFRRKVFKAIKSSGWNDRKADTLYLVGGTWRALAGFAMQDAGHPLSDPHGYQLTAEDALSLARSVRQTKPRKIGKSVLSVMRAESLPDAASLLLLLLEKLQPKRLVFSSWGLREGRLFDQLDHWARGQDPLLAGVADFSAPRGGQPTLATTIAGWTVDALPTTGTGSERVRLAATMLALASMQIEPNLRLRQSVNWALHKRWIDLSDRGRAMIAAALCANCGETDLPKTLRKLASEADLDEAIGWGMGIRLARRLGAGSRRSLRNSALGITKGRLMLRISESHADLRADHVQQDLAALAARLGRKPVIEIVPDDSLIQRDGFELPMLDLAMLDLAESVAPEVSRSTAPESPGSWSG